MIRDIRKYTKKHLAQDSTHLEKFKNKDFEITSNVDKVITALIDGEEVEFTNSIQFNKANIQSKITYKFVLDNGATLKALPKVIINKGASNINTHLSIKCLILDSKSRASVTPSLEIFEDNVKAGHGASIGALDKNQIYTLIKAGIKREVAVKILVKAFLT